MHFIYNSPERNAGFQYFIRSIGFFHALASTELKQKLIINVHEYTNITQGHCEYNTGIQLCYDRFSPTPKI